ncbi:MAG: hypothetical protein ACYC40_00740 [Patescibacteria group bacterium]
MFRKKKQPIEDNSLAEKVNQDLIVHNMPDQKRIFGNGFFGQSGVSSSFQVAAPKNNHKLVGILILVGGFIVIGVLIYLSFNFIIKPATQNNNVYVPIVNDKVVGQATDTSPISVSATVVPVSTTTPVATSSVDLIATTSSASSTALDALNGLSSDQAPPLIDSDNDGLYDEEEIALGTNPNLANWDGDAYPDKIELVSGYNPNGTGKLEADPALTKYSNKISNYEILYPKNWSLKEVAADNTVIFSAPDESIIQISVQDNPSKLSIMSWYADAFPGAALTYDKLKPGLNWDGVISEDNLNFYLTDKKHQKIYIISYLPIYSTRLAYPNLFAAMINSMVLK